MPFTHIPRVINPHKGYVIASNNKISSGNVRYGVGVSASPNHRSMRINQLIQEKLKDGRKITLDDMIEI